MKKSLSTNQPANLHTNRRNLILRVYLYVFMGTGLVIMSIGAFGLGQNIYKVRLFPKYPLEQYEESRCQYLETVPYPQSAQKNQPPDTQFIYEQNQQQASRCRFALEEERQVRKITDFYNSLILLIIGSLLFSGHLLVNWRTTNR